ncbi:MAG: hypothetical protein K2K32_02245, partial [Muribaculaceae bacterium]|nr:hypothetical protein [Muribaculaceae bacterium]
MKIFPLFTKKDSDKPKVTSESIKEIPVNDGDVADGYVDDINKKLEVPDSVIAEDMIETGVM